MSRWTEQFKNHQFQVQWQKLLQTVEVLTLSDETIATNVQELARLRKVITYLNELLQACDPELIPSGVWDSSHSQTLPCLSNVEQFIQNKNIAHLEAANSHLDNILSYIRPYIVSGKKAAQAAGQAFKAYSDTVKENIDLLRLKAQSTVSEIQKNKETSTNYNQEIVEYKQAIQVYERELFSENGLKTKINELVTQTASNHSQVYDYLQKLTKGNETESSIILQIEEARKKAISDSKTISSSLSYSNDNLEKLNAFYLQVFGEQNDDDEEAPDGLKKEIEQRISDLEDFKTKQLKTYQAKLEEIESLLPGATSAGLAKAYRDLKVSTERQVKKYSNIFYWSLAGLALTAFISSVHTAGFSGIEFIDTSNLTEWFSKFVYKLPIIGPALWLALFSSKRRSEFQRLQQEYAHKEALTKSYHSFKKQIEGLQEKDNTLMIQLLKSAIEATSFNASTTLDGKHGDKLPVQEVIDGLIDNLSDKVSFIKKAANSA
jgi:hypothetical protein